MSTCRRITLSGIQVVVVVAVVVWVLFLLLLFIVVGRTGCLRERRRQQGRTMGWTTMSTTTNNEGTISVMLKRRGGGQGGPNICGKIKQRQKMGSTTLTTTTNNNKNNKPRCYPQQRFGISFRYSFNEKIWKNSQACPLYMFDSSSARNLSTFEAAIGLRWRSNNYLAWAIILRLVLKVAHTRGEVARYFCNIRNLRNTKKTR